MHRRHDANVIGPMVSTLRYRRGWTQEQAVAKLQRLGCYMTRDIRLRKLRQHRRKSQHVLAATLHAFNVPITRDMLANWETCRSDVPARFIPFLAYALDAEVTDFLPNLSRHHVNELVRGRMAVEPRMREGGRDRHAVFSAPKTPLRQPRGRGTASAPN